MECEHNRYPTLSRRQVALFERNPVCRLCYDICLSMAEEYGGVRFALLQSLEAADKLCERILLNPWNLLGVDQYYHQIAERLCHSQPAIAAAFSTVCVTLHCIADLPEPVMKLARDLTGLIVGESNELYDELSSAASRLSISIAANTYGDIPPMPEQQRKLLDLQYACAQATTEIQTLKHQLKMQQDQTKGAFINYGTYIAEQHNDIHDNHNCSIYACPPSDTSSMPVDSPDMAEDIAPDFFCISARFSEDSIRDRLAAELSQATTKIEYCRALYRLQHMGCINIDQYASDAKRAAVLNEYQSKYSLSADDFCRARINK